MECVKVGKCDGVEDVGGVTVLKVRECEGVEDGKEWKV